MSLLAFSKSDIIQMLTRCPNVREFFNSFRPERGGLPEAILTETQLGQPDRPFEFL